jgi:TPR repeat protein
LGKLEPKKRDALKQMILMRGELAQSDCRASDPSTCQGKNINGSARTVKLQAAASEAKTEDQSQVIRSLSQTCKAGDSAACKRLAVISKELNKPRTSMQLYKMACDQGDAAVCRELSDTLSKAGKTDLSQLYLQKACSKGDTTACTSSAPAAKN